MLRAILADPDIPELRHGTACISIPCDRTVTALANKTVINPSPCKATCGRFPFYTSTIIYETEP